jgi:CubicO group peptidase (beta-lactamase class C family)
MPPGIALSPTTPSSTVASISKNILAAVVVRLAEQHRLSLDDDVTKYVANAPTHGVRITVRQLLNHTSGLYSFTSRSDAEANEQKVLSHEQVIGLFKDQPLDFPPGSSWRYDNSAFYLAGMVVEAVTGRLYADYIRDEVFRRLGMTSSSLCGAHDVPGIASGHDVCRRADRLRRSPGRCRLLGEPCARPLQISFAGNPHSSPAVSSRNSRSR